MSDNKQYSQQKQSSESRAQFESELKRRLSLKSSSEETALLKAFQYFDLNGTHTVSKTQFQQVLEKLGIFLPKEQIESLYNYYLTDNSFNYKQFASRLFQQSEQIVFYFQRKIIENGPEGFFNWLNQIPQLTVNYTQFKQIFALYPEDKMKDLFNYFNQNRMVNMQDVVTSLRGVLNPTGLYINQVDSNELMNNYIGNNKETVRKYLNIYFKFKNMQYLEQSDFEEFNYFLNLGGQNKGCWKGAPSYMQTPTKKLDFEQFDLSQIQEILGKKGVKAFVLLKKLLYQADDDQDGFLTERQTQKVLKEYKLPFQIGSIEIESFWKEILGEFEQKEIAKEIFDQIDIDLDGVIPYQLLKQCYFARNHPDVKNRNRSENEVLAEFLDAYEAHHKQGSKSVRYEEFEEFCHILYRVNGEKFEKIMTNVFQYNPPQYIQSQVSQYAPFGTSNEKTDYSTNLRPLIYSSQEQRKSMPAGLGLSQQKIEQIDPIKEQLKKKGHRGIIYMLKQMKRFDAQGIYNGFQTIRIQCQSEYIKSILNQRSDISMKQFLTKIIGDLPTWRLNLVNMAYRKLKSNNFEQMKNNFLARPRQHLNDEEVLIDFLDTFDSHHQLFKIQDVSQDEFQQYYQILSFNILDDREFEVALKSGWML